MGAKFEAIKHATSTGIMWHCENNLEQGSRIQVYVDDNALSVNVARIRDKLNKIGLTDFVKTKHRQGYTL